VHDFLPKFVVFLVQNLFFSTIQVQFTIHYRCVFLTFPFFHHGFSSVYLSPIFFLTNANSSLISTLFFSVSNVIFQISHIIWRTSFYLLFLNTAIFHSHSRRKKTVKCQHHLLDFLKKNLSYQKKKKIVKKLSSCNLWIHHSYA
jgi:hypothetical protein